MPNPSTSLMNRYFGKHRTTDIELEPEGPLDPNLKKKKKGLIEGLSDFRKNMNPFDKFVEATSKKK